MLTDTAIRNAKPRELPYKLGDSRGLYLLVTPSGGKWWRFDYRFGGKRKSLSMGTYPDVALKEARGRRDRAREHLAHGADPGEVRKAQKLLGQTATPEASRPWRWSGSRSTPRAGRQGTPTKSSDAWNEMCSPGSATGSWAK